ncbi:hypothetical protein IKZ80_04610, partial [bacterium]|nr:hypothetical protein [bacterium]
LTSGVQARRAARPSAAQTKMARFFIIFLGFRLSYLLILPKTKAFFGLPKPNSRRQVKNAHRKHADLL